MKRSSKIGKKGDLILYIDTFLSFEAFLQFVMLPKTMTVISY